MSHTEPWTHSRVFAGASRFGGDAPDQHRGGLFRLAEGAQQWERLGGGLPKATQVRAVAVNPTDPATVWCGTETGPYRSGDGGNSWELVPLPGQYQTVWSMGFDPQNQDRLYVGTAPAAVYRSCAGSARWELLEQAAIPERLDMGFPTRLISLAVNPLDPNDVWAGVEVGGMMHSGDGGLTWTDTTDALEALAAQDRYKSRLFSDTEAEGMLDIHKVVLSAAAPGAAFIGLRMGIFRSDDGGTQWQSLDVGRFSPLTYCRDVRVSPHDPKVLYAALSDESVGVQGRVYRSEDLGASWQRFDCMEPPATSTMMQVAPSPTNPAELWCATRRGDVWATLDGGASWQAFALPEGGRDIYTLVCG